MSLVRDHYVERSPSMQIMARRVDLRQSFERSRTAVATDTSTQRVASRVLILTTVAGLVLTIAGHL